MDIIFVRSILSQAGYEFCGTICKKIAGSSNCIETQKKK